MALISNRQSGNIYPRYVNRWSDFQTGLIFYSGIRHLISGKSIFCLGASQTLLGRSIFCLGARQTPLGRPIFCLGARQTPLGRLIFCLGARQSSLGRLFSKAIQSIKNISISLILMWQHWSFAHR
jgi:hypothetical protein